MGQTAEEVDDGFVILDGKDTDEDIKVDADVAKALIACDGKLPSKDPNTHSKVANILIKSWGITRAPEIMLVNRMVGTWMKLRRVEELLGKYDLFFERRDEGGNIIGIKMNEAAHYLTSLEAEFRAYYKALDGRREGKSSQKGTDFLEFIDITPKKEGKKAK